MICLKVTAPFACFRPGHARGHIDTDMFPSPCLCYGLLESLVGEYDRRRHLGVKIAPGLFSFSPKTRVLRKVNYWQCKDKQGNNLRTRPDYQEILSDVKVLIWVDSSGEEGTPTLEDRIKVALTHPEKIERQGALSLGESKFLVDSVNIIEPNGEEVHVYELNPRGRHAMPVWTNHINNDDTVWVLGNLAKKRMEAPDPSSMPTITSPN